MPRTSKPLKILVDNNLRDSPEIMKLAAQGHDVNYMHMEDAGYDLILSPRAWRVLPSLLKHIDVAVKAARAVKFPAKPKAKRASRAKGSAPTAAAAESDPAVPASTE